MTRLIFTDPNLRKQVVNWKEFADFTLGVFRCILTETWTILWFEEFVRQMCKESEEFLTLWRLHDVQQKKAILYTFDHPVVGRLYFQLNTFSNFNGDENLHCCVFTPIAGTDTEQKLVDIRK